MKRISLIIGLCITMMITGCAGKAQEDIETINIIQEEVENIEVYGEVVVEESKEIVIDFPAIVEKLHIKDGQKVKKGDKLITLDFKDYQSLIETKENEIKIYEIQLKNLRGNINPIGLEVERIKQELVVKRNYLETNTDPDIAILQRSLDIAISELEESKKEYEKNKELFDIGAIAEKALQDLEQGINLKEKEKNDIITKIEQIKTSKQLEISALTSALQSNERQLTNGDKSQAASIEEMNVRIKMAQLELEGMKNKTNRSYIKDNTIISEGDSLIVYDIVCMEGSRVGEIQGPVMKVMNLDTMIITIDIPEEYIGKVGLGDRVEVELSAEDQSEIRGKISRISDLAVEKNGETIIKAEVSVEKGIEMLKPGLTVDAKIYE